eukprot:3205772-Amphidinium_carterae.1
MATRGVARSVAQKAQLAEVGSPPGRDGRGHATEHTHADSLRKVWRLHALRTFRPRAIFTDRFRRDFALLFANWPRAWMYPKSGVKRTSGTVRKEST